MTPERYNEACRHLAAAVSLLGIECCEGAAKTSGFMEDFGGALDQVAQVANSPLGKTAASSFGIYGEVVRAAASNAGSLKSVLAGVSGGKDTDKKVAAVMAAANDGDANAAKLVGQMANSKRFSAPVAKQAMMLAIVNVHKEKERLLAEVDRLQSAENEMFKRLNLGASIGKTWQQKQQAAGQKPTGTRQLGPEGAKTGAPPSLPEWASRGAWGY